MSKHNHLSICVFVVLLLGGCSGFSVPENLNYSIEVAEPDRVRFSGRGAGAGMMLSGTMGAMGVAIGVAIDEGIGKDIGEIAKEAGIRFPELLKEVVANQYEFPVDWVDERDAADNTYIIQRYGFVTAPGGDEVYPHFVIQVIDADGVERVVNIPDDFSESPEKLPLATFGDIKTNAGEIERLWREGIALALDILD